MIGRDYGPLKQNRPAVFLEQIETKVFKVVLS